MSSTRLHNVMNFGPLAAEIDPIVWGAPAKATGFESWQRYCTASSSGRQPNFAALKRGRHLCSAGRPSRGALAHILVLSSFFFFFFSSPYAIGPLSACLSRLSCPVCDVCVLWPNSWMDQDET